MNGSRIFLLVAIFASATHSGFAADDHSVAATLASFRLANPDLAVELVASEPDVIDPVAVAWDEDERIYVVEMRDYPSGPGSGSIRLLEDVDGDGRYEKSTLFAEGLHFPSSCLPWNGGLLVTSAPDILFLKDTDGDGRADERKVVLTGFALGDQQLRVNGLTFGLDGWVYAANGRNGGAVRRPGDPESAAVSIRRNDLRFLPETGDFQTVAGPSQFGLARDDWGDRFLSWNTVPIRHVAIEDRYLVRNPALQGESGVAPVIPASDIGRVFPAAPPQRRFNRESADFFNATCGPTIYRGDLLPGLQGDAFVCESLGSLVHHRKIVAEGSTFAARRAEEDREFLASTDPWFRPVNLATGPDGALYVVDFCREWVEHPDFIPAELRKGVDFRAGDNLGRVWRIRPKSAPPARRRVRMRASTPAELIGFLNDANGWRRDQAQRLLIQRGDVSVAAPLAELATKASAPRARLAALWTLAAIETRLKSRGLLTDDLLRAALKDAAPEVRRGAIEILEPRLLGGRSWGEDLAPLAADPEMKVRLQIALAAGFIEGKGRGAILRAVARAGPADRWLRLALVSSVGAGAWEFIASITAEEASGEEPTKEVRRLLADMARAAGAMNDPAAVAAFTGYCGCDGVSQATQIPILAGFLEGLDLRGADAREALHVAADAAASNNASPTGVDWYVDRARAMAVSSEIEPEDRAAAARVLSLAPIAEALALWTKLVTSDQPEEVRAEAARGLGRMADAAAVERLLASWDRVPASARRPLMVALSRRPATAEALLAAAEARRVSVIELRGAAGEALASHADPKIRAHAAKVFAAAGGGARAEVASRYRSALEKTGDAAKGADHFARNCVVCHRFQGVGQSVGPDLSGVASRSKAKLLSDILDPSSEIAPDFVNYIVATKSGESTSGLLARESPAGVTLRQAQGAETTIPADQIAEFRAGNLSLMPEGFEEALDERAMADLLEFLHRGDRAMLEAALPKSDPAKSVPRP